MLSTHAFSRFVPLFISTLITFSASTASYAQETSDTVHDLTLLRDMQAALSASAEPSTFTYDDFTQLSALLLGTDNPLVEVATLSNELSGGYPGAKLSNNDGQAIYLAVNPLSSASDVTYGDGISASLEPNGMYISLQSFAGRYSVTDFGGEFVLDGTDFSVTTTRDQLETPSPTNGRYYAFSDEGLSVDDDAIYLTGVINVVGTDADDTFDLSQTTSSATYPSYLNGGLGSDTLIGSNSGSGYTWQIGGENQGSVGTSNLQSMNFEAVESLVGGNSEDIFEISATFDGTISGGASNDTFSILTSPQTNTEACNTGNSGTISTENLSNNNCPQTSFLFDASAINLSGEEATLTETSNDTKDSNTIHLFDLGADTDTHKSGGGSFSIFGILIGLMLLGRCLPKTA